MFKRKRIAIDLGTSNTRIWVSGEGLVLDEPTVVAVATDDNRVVAIGVDAKEMLGRTPEALVAVTPIKEGVIADYRITESLLSYFIGKVIGKFQVLKPDVMMSVPVGATQVEKRAALDALLSAGAAHAYLIDGPLASAIGAGIPVSAASGSMVLEIGGGISEAAVISLGGVVISSSVRVGGVHIDQAVQEYCKKNHSIIIGTQTAEEVKKKIGSATRITKDEKIEISGRDLVFGLPKSLTVSSSEITQALQDPLYKIVTSVRSVLEDTPPELASDIIDKGIVMCGGGALLRNIDRLMTEETGVPSHIVTDAQISTIQGSGVVLENIDLWKRSIIGKK